MPHSGTRVTLLGRLRDPTNQTIWAEFVEHYGTKIFIGAEVEFARGGCQDVTQNVCSN